MANLTQKNYENLTINTLTDGVVVKQGNDYIIIESDKIKELIEILNKHITFRE